MKQDKLNNYIHSRCLYSQMPASCNCNRRKLITLQNEKRPGNFSVVGSYDICMPCYTYIQLYFFYFFNSKHWAGEQWHVAWRPSLMPCNLTVTCRHSVCCEIQSNTNTFWSSEDIWTGPSRLCAIQSWVNETTSIHVHAQHPVVHVHWINLRSEDTSKHIV